MSDKRGTVRVEHLSKRFRIPQHEHQSLRGRLLHPLSRPTYLEFDAVRDVSFHVDPGEFFGIIGRNGSGKSTLLKLVAGIYRADGGTARVTGSLASFIELGVGFNMDLSGRDNLYINGALLGLSRREIKRRYDQIVEFAELGDFMDLKLRNYSSGMQVRLAFSVALQAEADVLLTDEVLAVGDARFQEKCFDIFQDRKERGKTIVFVSHDMGAIQQFCDRVVLLDKGAVQATGSAPAMSRAYMQVNAMGMQRDADGEQEEAVEQGEDVEHGAAQSAATEQDGAVQIVAIWTEDQARVRSAQLQHGAAIVVCVQVEAIEAQNDIAVGVTFRDAIGQTILSGSSAQQTVVPALAAGEQVVVAFEVDNILANGTYTIDCIVTTSAPETAAGEIALDMRRHAATFESTGARDTAGVVDTSVVVGVERALDKEHIAPVASAGSQLLVAGFTGGVRGRQALLAVDPVEEHVMVVDELYTTALACDGTALLRTIRADRLSAGVEAIAYDEHGVRSYTRIDDVRDVRGIRGLRHQDGRALLLATGSSQVVSSSWSTGSTEPVWSHTDGAGSDAVHASAIADGPNGPCIAMFGGRDIHGSWNESFTEPTGAIVDAQTGDTLVGGLTAPSSFVWLGDGWLVCDIARREIVQLDAHGRELRCAAAPGWPRGVAADDEHFYVGSSANRFDPEQLGSADILVLDRATLQIVRAISLPYREVFDVCIATAALARAASVGSPAVELRRRIRSTPRLDADSGRLLKPSQMRATVTASLSVHDWVDGAPRYVSCSIENGSDIAMGTVSPHPVQLAYRWTGSDGRMVSEGRQPLPGMLQPGSEVDVQLAINPAPAGVQPATLTISLVQEGVAWFCDVDPDHGLRRTVDPRTPSEA